MLRTDQYSARGLSACSRRPEDAEKTKPGGIKEFRCHSGLSLLSVRLSLYGFARCGQTPEHRLAYPPIGTGRHPAFDVGHSQRFAAVRCAQADSKSALRPRAHRVRRPGLRQPGARPAPASRQPQ